MGSIATTRGDTGQTGLSGGIRVSKVSIRVEAYGGGVVRLMESGEAVQPAILAYLNRPSDLLWLCARKLELDAGVNSLPRAQTAKDGHRWSRAW